MPVTPLSVFISYSRTDTNFVNSLDADLKTHGFRTWVDRGRLEGGDEWLDIIQQAIEDCDVLLVVLSSDAINSRFVKLEYRYAQKESKLVIPLYYRRCAKVPIDLNDIHWVNFLEPDNAYDNALQELLRALRRIKPSQEQIKPSPHPHQEMIDLVEKAKEPPLVAPQPAPAVHNQPSVVIEGTDKTVASNRPASAISGGPLQQQSEPEADHNHFADDDPKPPFASHPTPNSVSSPTRVIPSPGADTTVTPGNVIELPHRGKATLPLSPRQSGPAGVPPVPARPPEPESATKLPRPQRSSGKMPAAGVAGAAAGGAMLGAASAAPPTRTSGAVAGSPTGAVVPRTGGGANLPPRTPPPGGGGRGGRGPTNRRRNVLLLVFAALLVIALLACGIVAFAAPGSGVGQVVHSTLTRTQPPATVTITSASKTVQDNYTIVGGSTTNATQRQVAVRTITGSSQSPSKPVNATGHNAHGTLTFFNALTVSRQISAGQTLDAGGGVKIVTDETAFIPAGSGPTEGSVSVRAHATPAGKAGDIGALTFNSVGCCAPNITVSNDAAFTDGKDAVDYTWMQQSDVNGAITQTVKDKTGQDAVADLNKQLHPGEQQTGSTRCVPTTNADQPVGDKGTNTTSANVTYLVKCTATVYDYAGAQNIVQGLLKEKATADPTLKGYQLAGAIQTSIAGQTNTRNVFSLFFNAKGIWVYQLTDAQKLQLARAIAGKSIARAQSLLNAATGVAFAKIDVSSGNILPTDPHQIVIVIQPVAGLEGQGTPAATIGSPIVTSPTVQSGNPPGIGGS